MVLIVLFIWLKSYHFIFLCDQAFSSGMELFKIISNPESMYVPWQGVIAKVEWGEWNSHGDY